MTQTHSRSVAALFVLFLLSCGGGSSTPPDEFYTLEIRYGHGVAGLPDDQEAVLRDAVEEAARRVRLMITAGLVPTRIRGLDCEGDLETIRIDETVRGLVVYVSYGNVGGGATLASSGPCIIRRRTKFPLVSVLQFNSASSATNTALGAQGTPNEPYVRAIALHEMFHTLGLGTIWEDHPGLVVGDNTDPQYTGDEALNAAKAHNDAPAGWPSLPVEPGTQQGTSGAHWRKTTFGNELLTGSISTLETPQLSEMTIASLADLGYHVDITQADDDPQYSVPPLLPPALRALTPADGISFGDDILRIPPAIADDL